MPFQIMMLQLIGGLIMSTGLGFLLGWKLLPATDTVLKGASWCYAAVSLLLIAFAIALVGLCFVGQSSLVPVWVAMVALFVYFATAGTIRGLSIQKNGRWV